MQPGNVDVPAGRAGEDQGKLIMTDSQLLFAACGLYCGACYHHLASRPEGQHLLDDMHRQGRPLEGYTCQGCRSDILYIHPGCAQCELRACADSKEILHCGLCTEFPCEQLIAFQNDGRAHHLDILTQLEELRAKGPDRWLAEQEQRWQCQCGASFSWYEATCHHCGASLDSYGGQTHKE
jgi:hypothetical protein